MKITFHNPKLGYYIRLIKKKRSGGSVESHQIHTNLSPVRSFRGQWWFGMSWFPEVHSQHNHLPGHFSGLGTFLYCERYPKPGSVTTVYEWSRNSPDLTLIQAFVRRKMKLLLSMQIELPLNLRSGTIASMLHHIDVVFHPKGSPTKYWVHRNERTFQKPDISVWNTLSHIDSLLLDHLTFPRVSPAWFSSLILDCFHLFY